MLNVNESTRISSVLFNALFKRGLQNNGVSRDVLVRMYSIYTDLLSKLA